MKIVFVSNYFNHHQRALSEALFARTGGDFTFVETTVMREERRKLGYGEAEVPAYVLHAERQPGAVADRIAGADVLIAGSAPESMLRGHIRAGKPLFRYAERPFKEPMRAVEFLPRYVKWHARHPVGKPVYLLCAGAYTAADYARFGLFRGRAYRWGYFPKTVRYASEEALFAGKCSTDVLWCGRFLDWKHPDDALTVAERLRAAGKEFCLRMIGTGEMEQALARRIAERGLSDCVTLCGAMKPDEVRREMERAGILLFTSDRKEGWGAVLNEAMNSGCAVVASRAAGSVPYLVRDGENGLSYPSGETDALTRCVERLLDAPEEQRRLGLAAYRTVCESWNAEVAAERLLCLAERVLAGERSPEPFENGPCSPAPILADEKQCPKSPVERQRRC